MRQAQIILVDPDVARGARIRAMIESVAIGVQTYQTAACYRAAPRGAVLYLIADEKRLLQSMTVWLSPRRDPVWIIAYRAEPAVHDVVEAMKLGAHDYLSWPFEPGALLQRISSLAPAIAQTETRPDRTAAKAALPRGNSHVHVFPGGARQALAHLPREKHVIVPASAAHRRTTINLGVIAGNIRARLGRHTGVAARPANI